MSGITPILDTLLHQVLGRRDVLAERALPDDLILPARAARPPQIAHSDSRLDPRALLGTDTRQTLAPRSEPRAGLRAAANPAAHTAAELPRLSSAARAIADILARFPAPPEAIRPQAPLTAGSQSSDPAALAALLRASIESSGLFYESHLRRWSGGHYPLERLLREPQMQWRGGPPAPVGTPAANAGPGPAAQPLPAAGPPHAGVPAGADPGVTTLALTYGADGKPATVPFLQHVDATLPPASQTASVTQSQPQAANLDHGSASIVRHQLETLAQPVLRWEGAPWAGAFMAVSMQAPTFPPEWQGGQRDAEAREDDAQPWQSHLNLQLQRLGDVAVELRLEPRRLQLDLQAAPHTAARLHAASGALRERLAALGFAEVAVRIRGRDTPEAFARAP